MSNPRLLACCDSSAGGPARNGPARPHPTTASENIGNSKALFQVIDERTVTDLLVEQVEFANVIVVNKVDLAGAEQARGVEAVGVTFLS